MCNIILRDYQREALKSMESEHECKNRILLSLPTGTGKTYVAATYAKNNFLDREFRVLWIAHTEELLNQAYKTFHEELGIDPSKICCLYAGLEKLKDKPKAKLWLMNNLVKTRPGKALSLVVIDEAHHTPAGTYTDILVKLKCHTTDKGPRVLGLTATPYRLHEGSVASLLNFEFPASLRPLVPQGVKYFESIAYKRSFCELAAEHYVAPFRQMRFDTEMRFDMREHLGDFSPKSLDQLNTPQRNKFVYDVWNKNRNVFGKTLIFVGRVEHARKLSELFGGDGGCAVAGDKIKRAEIVEAFRTGKISVMVNVGIYKEGVDVPDIKTVILARPTMSPMLFLQMIGRGSRVLPDKKFFYLVDIHDQLGEYEGYLAKVDDLGDREPVLVKAIEDTARNLEKIAKSPVKTLADVPGLLFEILEQSGKIIVTKFFGWVTFHGDAGPSPVGALLNEAEYLAMEQHDVNGEVAVKDPHILEQISKVSETLNRCARALGEGLIGNLRRFLPKEDERSIEELKEAATELYAYVQPSVAIDFKVRLEKQALIWGAKESTIGRCMDEYLVRAITCGGVITMRDGDNVSLRVVTKDAVCILERAMEAQQDGKLGFHSAPQLLAELQAAQPDLKGAETSILDAVAQSKGLSDFCLRVVEQ
jgi:superfamily II DNA or RNA helicase